MCAQWYELDSVRQLPFPHQIYAWWVRRGVKRTNGLVYGGNRLFSLLRMFYSLFPHGGENFTCVPAYSNKFLIAIDLLDFEVPHHTLPISTGATSETKLLELLFPPGGVFFDVGANHGFYSLVASSIGGGEAAVYAFEPQPRLAHALSISKEKNGFDNLRIRQVALGDREREAEFFIPDTGSGIGSTSRAHASRTRPVKVTRVRMTTLDAVFKKEGIPGLDVVKIDVEGSEYDVLRGGRATISEHLPFIWFEVNPDAQRVAGRDPEQLYLLLEELGYSRFYDIDDIVRGLKKTTRVTGKLANVLAVPECKKQVLESH